MKTIRLWLPLCATICSVLLLALLLGFAANGSGYKLYSHGLDPIPDGGDGGLLLVHGLDPIPDGGDGGIRLAHGLDPIPDGGDGGIRLA
jgi:hypothetical protein